MRGTFTHLTAFWEEMNGLLSGKGVNLTAWRRVDAGDCILHVQWKTLTEKENPWHPLEFKDFETATTTQLLNPK